MGIICCHSSQSFPLDTRKILQFQRPLNSIKTSSSQLCKDNEIPLTIYDVEEEKIFESYINLRIISSLQGISELSINNSLYLCGTSDESNIGSYLFKIVNNKYYESVLSILVNSQYVHIYPSMIYNPNNNSIFTIGGISQLNCESYDISCNKWRFLPELPEERFQGNLIFDSPINYCYLFGGKNSHGNSVYGTILRLNIDTLMIWEKLIVKSSELISKTLSAMFVFAEDRNGIYIAGGRNNKGEILNEIVRYDTKQMNAKIMDHKLKEKAEFHNQSETVSNYSKYFFIDTCGNIHQIERGDLKLIEEISIKPMKSTFNKLLI